MQFTPIPDESQLDGAGFTRRPIRKAGETDLLLRTEKLLARFAADGAEMLVSDMQDLVTCLHRTALLVQKTKQAEMLHRFAKYKKTAGK